VIDHSYAYCSVSISPVRANPQDTAEMTSQLVFGETVLIHESLSPWCLIESTVDGYKGYVDQKQLLHLNEAEFISWVERRHVLPDFHTVIHTPWGKQHVFMGAFLAKDATFDIGKNQFVWDLTQTTTQSLDMMSVARSLLNVPYLWGGKTSAGIDCSGYMQLIFRLMGVDLPRDARDQQLCGEDIAFEHVKTGDLAFFHNEKGNVTHVGLLDGEGNIFHASGWVRNDKLTFDGIVHRASGMLTHHLHSIKRINAG
jgi:hypothetical protein